MQILLIIWIAVWQYFIIFFYFRNQISLPINEGNVWTCACTISLGHFDLRLYIHVFGSHSRNKDEFTVSCFSRRKFIFLFLRKLFEFWAFANFLDHLDCSLAVFFKKYTVYYLRKQISLPSMKVVVRSCACAISLGHLDFRVFMFGSHSWNQDEFTVSFISRQVHLPIFRGSCLKFELIKFSWSFGS